MGLDKFIEAIVALFILIVFSTIMIPALVNATGVSIPFINLMLFLAFVGIVIGMLKELFD